MLISRRNQLLLEFSFWNEPLPRPGPNIYELRTYHLKVSIFITVSNSLMCNLISKKTCNTLLNINRNNRMCKTLTRNIQLKQRQIQQLLKWRNVIVINLDSHLKFNANNIFQNSLHSCLPHCCINSPFNTQNKLSDFILKVECSSSLTRCHLSVPHHGSHL